MNDKILIFFQEFYKTKHDNFSINYREGKTINILTVSDAIERFKLDFNDLKFLLAHHTTDWNTVFAATCHLWEKHLIKFN